LTVFKGGRSLSCGDAQEVKIRTDIVIKKTR
jgi:hypothetical protein